MRSLIYVLALLLAFGDRGIAAEKYVSDSERKLVAQSKASEAEALQVMTEVDGIPIPRVERDDPENELRAAIPVDAGNPDAQRNPSDKASGGRIVVRMSSEPRTMNPITEISAVQSLMSEPYVMQSLVSKNPETFEFEPLLAKRWTVEDSVKLSPLLRDYQRSLQINGGEIVTEATYEFPESGPEEHLHELQIFTYGPDRKKIGNTWVGLFPTGEQNSGHRNGHHFWSNDEGNLTVSGLTPGEYRVLTGAEIIGKAEEIGCGWIRVTPVSPHNPLTSILGTGNCLLLNQDAYVDIERETVFTFEIDEDARWSDGVPFTSRDIAFGYAVISNPVVDGDSLRAYYSNLIRCDPLDDRTVRMQYRQQYFLAFEFASGLAVYSPPWHLFEATVRDFAGTLTLERLSEEEERAQNKLSAHGSRFGRIFNFEDAYSSKPIGTGPYVIDRWTKGERLVLKRNPNYWSHKQKGYLDEIVFQFIRDDLTALQALEAGVIDFLYRIPAERSFELLDSEPEWFRNNYVMSSWYIPLYSYIGWNQNRTFFRDRRVRIAMTLALDLERLLKEKFRDQGVLVSGSSYYSSPSYDHEVKPIGYDLETARKLLKAAGWSDTDGDGILDKDGESFEFTLLMTSTSPNAENLAAMLREECGKVGVQVNVDRLEWGSLLEKVMTRDFDAVTLAWMASIESDPYQIWHSSGSGPDSRSSNLVSFNNPLADELIEELRITNDSDKRSAIARNFHRLLDREQPYTFLYTPKEFGAYHKRYHGVKWYMVRPGFDLTEWYIPEELQRD